MNTRIGMVALLLAGVMLSATAGCTSTVIKEGAGIVTGAKGTFAPVRPVAASDTRPLGQYTHFELGTFTDDFGGNVPPDLMMYCREAFPETLAGKKIPNDPSGKTLLIRGTIFHYESASTLGVAIGPLEEVVARVDLVDKDTGAVLGTSNCIGRTTSRVNIGVEKKGQGLAKAIVAWIDKLYPEQGRME